MGLCDRVHAARALDFRRDCISLQGIEAALAYLHEGLRTPPPSSLTLAPGLPRHLEDGVNQ